MEGINNNGMVYTLHLFAGSGGGILGDMLLGYTPIGAVEIEEFPRATLLARQNDRILPRFPIWDDVTTFSESNEDCREYFEFLRSIRNNLCVSGGFPCTDISVAGKGAGIEGKNSGLWSEMCRIIGEVRPRYIFLENSPAIITRGIERVIGDLSEIRYDLTWGVVSASDVGAWHRRDRFWGCGTDQDSRTEFGFHPFGFIGRSKVADSDIT